MYCNERRHSFQQNPVVGSHHGTAAICAAMHYTVSVRALYAATGDTRILVFQLWHKPQHCMVKWSVNNGIGPLGLGLHKLRIPGARSGFRVGKFSEFEI